MTTRTFNKLKNVIQCTLVLEDGTDFLIPMREDGYIHANKLCNPVKKQPSAWRKLVATKELIEKLEVKLSSEAKSKGNIKPIEIYKGNNGTYTRGTWIHPDLGFNLAQWCSPSFALQVSKWIKELIITGTVKQGFEKCNDDIIKELQLECERLKNECKIKDDVIISQEGQNTHLEKELARFRTKHQSHLHRREIHKLREGKCVYLINMIEGDHSLNSDILKIKIGYTNNITRRVSGFRTANPYCKLLYVMFTDKALSIESIMKERYEKQLMPNNREFISDVSIDELANNILTIAELINSEYTIEPQSDIDQFNDIVTETAISDSDSDEDTPTHKRCGGTVGKHLTEEDRLLPIEKFHKNKNNKDGRQRLCAECIGTGKYGDKRNRRKRVTIPKFDITTHKWCNLCEKAKIFDFFFKDKSTADGYHSNCKACKGQQKRNQKINKAEKAAKINAKQADSSEENESED